MFDKTAQHYDLLYEKGLGKDYAAESAMVADLLPGAKTLLDVACGTGLHLRHLSGRFDCAGVDLDEGMLAIARTRCPDVPLHVGDMADFDLGQHFDAIVCLFSSIGYVRTEDGLRSAAAAMARHLRPGGTLLVEPWITTGAWKPGFVHMLTADAGDVKVCRASVSAAAVDGCSSIEFHYLIAAPGGIEHRTETHTLGLFTWDQYRSAFEDAGLDVTIDAAGGPMGRGLLTGRS